MADVFVEMSQYEAHRLPLCWASEGSITQEVFSSEVRLLPTWQRGIGGGKAAFGDVEWFVPVVGRILSMVGTLWKLLGSFIRDRKSVYRFRCPL